MEHLGNYGVRCFFIISGFLITTLLLKELAATGTVSLTRFYIRRSLRIFPASYAYVALIGLAASAGWITLYSGDLLHAWSYTMNYQNIQVSVPHARANGWYLNHLWSLSVEEQFYLLWPATVCLLTARRALKVAGAVVIAGPLVRLLMAYLMSASPEDMITTALSRQFEAVSDALATGCVLAGAYNWLGTKVKYQAFLRSRYFILVAILGGIFPTLLFLKSAVVFWVLSQTILNITIALCVERCVRYPEGLIGAILNASPMTAVGALSYSLYLWQEPFLNRFQGSALCSFPTNLLLVVAAAMLSYHFVERPFLQLKAKLERKWSTPEPIRPHLSDQAVQPMPSGNSATSV
jgi:peptidoglycan/LPS O-acetylase OafA/YrhL